MHTGNLRNFANHCHLNKLNVKKSQRIKCGRIWKKYFFTMTLFLKEKNLKNLNIQQWGIVK